MNMQCLLEIAILFELFLKWLHQPSAVADGAIKIHCFKQVQFALESFLTDGEVNYSCLLRDITKGENHLKNKFL